MLDFFKNEANIYFKMFSRESEKAADGLELLSELIRKIEQKGQKTCNSQDILKYMRLISTFCTTLETFNSNVETLIAGTDEETFNQASKSRLPHSIRLRVSDWIRSDLSAYHIGDSIQITISHIVNSARNLCFIRDVAKGSSIDYHDHIEAELEELPELGVIFALPINMKFLRAIRINTEPTNTSIRIRLIDVGETISISPNVLKYSISIEAQNMPPAGILCQIDKIDGCPVKSLDSVKRLVTHDAIISDICMNMMVMDLFTISDIKAEATNKILHDSIVECANQSNDSIESKPLHNTNPFLFDMVSSSKSSSPTDNSDPFTMNDLDDSLLVPIEKPSPPALPPVPPRQLPAEKNAIRIPMRIVQKQQEVLKSVQSNRRLNLQIEIPNSESIDQNGNVGDMIKDDAGDFPNVTGTRPKEMDSYRQNKETLMDRSYFEMSKMESLPTPPIGEEILVIPRHIVNFEEMFVQLLPLQKFNELFELIQQMQHELKPMKYIPRANDYVLARYSADQCIYRAKVVQIIDANKIMVYYIDYGNTEPIVIDNLYEWERVCDTIPAQAVFCRLANIRRAHNVTTNDSLRYIMQNCLNKECKGLVIGPIDGGILLNLRSSLGYDLADEIMTHFHAVGIPGSVV